MCTEIPGLQKCCVVLQTLSDRFQWRMLHKFTEEAGRKEAYERNYSRLGSKSENGVFAWKHKCICPGASVCICLYVGLSSCVCLRASAHACVYVLLCVCVPFRVSVHVRRFLQMSITLNRAVRFRISHNYLF